MNLDAGWRTQSRQFGLGLLLVLILIASRLSSARNQDSTSSIDALFATVIPASPGAAVMVVRGRHPIFERGYGVTDLHSLHKIDEHTNFRLASVTKQFTAMAVMLLVHNGKLRYEQTLTDILPEFPAYGKFITIRNLLNHTSGLVDYEDLMAKEYGDTPDDQIPQIKDAGVLALLEKVTSTKFAPGSKWEYSNSGYCLLAMVVEKVSGESFGQFLRDHIFAPLQMSNTIAFEKGKNEVPNRAYGHTLQNGVWHDTDQSSTSATLGDGGVYTSLADLVRWDAALRDHTLLTEKEMLPAITPVQPSSSPAKETDGRPVSYGFGWFLEPYQGHPRMWHYGETVGFRTSIQRFPSDDLTVVVLCNRVDLDAPDLALKIADLYLKSNRRK
jgi:CubicO group peptidase (beta-lactamase class C family)